MHLVYQQPNFFVKQMPPMEMTWEYPMVSECETKILCGKYKINIWLVNTNVLIPYDKCVKQDQSNEHSNI